MQSEIILLSNVKQENVANLVQKEFEMLGITNIKGKRIDAERSAIHKNVAEALADYNVIMIIGGVGENHGNMTVSAVSAAIGFPTVLKDGEVFPEGAEIFKNKRGKPSGCAISQGNQCIIMLPGESDTLQFMLCYRVSAYLADFIGAPHAIKTLRVAGTSKAQAEEAVSAAETADAAVRVFEDADEIAVQVYARGVNRKEAIAKVNNSIRSIAGEIGSGAYAVDAENIGQAFGQELAKKDLKAAIAVEGIQRNEISAAAYTNEYVGNYLGTSQGVEKYDIPEKLLKRHGANSAWTAAVLAGEVCKTYNSNIGIAITTDPTKNNEGANIAVCMGDNVWTEHVTAATRDELIAVAGARAIHLARNVVSAYPKLYENSVSLRSAVSGKSKFRTSESKSSSQSKWYSRFIPMKGDSKTDLIRKIVFIVCVLVFIGCMGYLSTKLFDSINQGELEIKFEDMITAPSPDVPEEVVKEWGYNPKLYTLWQENNDLSAYIKIDDTNVRFPVVQTAKANDKGLTGQYYLRKDYYGAYSMYGTPFIDYRCEINPSEQSKNIIVYGHNVYNDGKMFSDLIKYRQLKFYKQHPVVHFDTLYGDFDWLVVGVILTNAYEKDGPVWEYHNFINGTEETTKDFVSQVAKRTMIVTGVDYGVNDNYLTLSTCSYDFTDARVVIVARQVREGEDISTLDTSKAYYNSNPLMPDKWYQAVSEAQQSESDATFGEAENPEAELAVESIEISGMPGKLNYKVGESVDTSGIMLRVKYSDGSVKNVADGYEVYPSEPFAEPGTYEIVIGYKDCWANYNVYVEEAQQSESAPSESQPEGEATVTSIAVLREPEKKEYTIGDKFETKGLTVRVEKSDSTYEDITEGFKTDPKRYDILEKSGEQEVKVTYKGFTAIFKIKVKPAETSSETSSESQETSSENQQTSSESQQAPSQSQQTSSESTETSSTISLGGEGSVVEENSGTNTNKVTNVSGASGYYARSLNDTVKVNGVTMSVYDAVCQIVAYEAGTGQPDEHVKAQAVASYTYLMYHGGNVSAGVSTKKLDNQIKRCVAEVIGYAVLDDRSNKFILATYFSESCGETADAEWVWGYYNRNLISVPSPVDGKAEKTYTISSSEFASKVRSKAGINLSGDPSNWISISSYWEGTDYVNKVNLGGTQYSARKLRETVLGTSKLRSTAFDVKYNSSTDSFVFTMRGYGHGVGLSAVGSIAYAKQGYKWDEILMKYYSNCYIGQKY
ncbi:MAG: sortase [Oscillospiraceae bacterium]|nr:sortase [Oscillospiraceae bacterium]